MTLGLLTPQVVLHDLASELVSLVDVLVDDLRQVNENLEALRPVAISRAEIASELLPGVEIDRDALKAECLDLALLLASKDFMTAGDVRTRTMLLATALAGAA